MNNNSFHTSNKHASVILNSYLRWTGKSLLDHSVESGTESEVLFRAPLVILSHGTEPDPILNYGNQMALELWEVNRETFTQTPSRLTAEPMEREERAAFLKAVSENGYVDNYTGIRISNTGRRFYIMQATVWNLTDDNDVFHGQAAAFRQFRYIE
ncbi:MEKHLA domain-containing protein [Paenibacillus glucanolyticus]|uniref:MEKHLA domain-containing protein n=1 Tax=Paenibacillus glucanolyticus TaxID=59843 RepID=UPI00096C7364|nr:MEKHLA domain-containing protein [Paenibacillus glucanolyticus]OMF69942.1 MEKHLA domain-containing protein [Paenibacillus glucanolyticus]